MATQPLMDGCLPVSELSWLTNVLRYEAHLKSSFF
jgi:hypothetical protein